MSVDPSSRAAIVGGGCAVLLALAAVAVGVRALRHEARRFPPTSPAHSPATVAAEPESPSAPGSSDGFLYGRIATVGGATYEGRLRWGGDQEAFWGDSFHGFKPENRWLAHVPPERRSESRPLEIFGFTIGSRKRGIAASRPFVARFGEIARIEARGDLVQVTLKSGTRVDLDRFDASDFDDGVRVWDASRGVVDLDSLQIRAIELLPTPPLRAAPSRLRGTVRTRQGDFTGFVAWRGMSLGTDELGGRTAEGEPSLRFDAIRAIARHARDSSLVTLLDGREIVLSGTAEIGDGNRGVEVDDPRFGRVLVSWDAFERVDFDAPGPGAPADSGPAYDDFPPGRPLRGSVATRGGRRLAGRLVYDLDESETSDSLDGEVQGVQYALPFGRVGSIALPGTEERSARGARVTLRSGEELQLERAGDLGERNAGLLIFVDGGERPEYVPWSDVARIEFDGPPAADPAPAGS